MAEIVPSLDDPRAMVVPDMPLLEGVLRISIVYLSLYALIRFFLRRVAGSLAISDLLVIVPAPCRAPGG